MYLYGLSGGIQADIGPRCRLDQGFAEEKSGDQPGRCKFWQSAGTKWNAFIDAGCASHMKKAQSLAGGVPPNRKTWASLHIKFHQSSIPPPAGFPSPSPLP
ncbi:hypothetical protein NCCP2145_03890 [Pseudarthrobacter sp. NCCP-2145]|nr:hypothetical protein NCCP2145_03890 [Pseudarthrobacter sp. NCCP-2145]